MLGFETLTLAPIHRGLIEAHMLSREELAWMDEYHALVRERLLPLLNDEPELAAWLADATASLYGATP